jgi:hypothetical protein
LRIGVVASFQTLGIIKENKVIQTLMLSKNVNNKKKSEIFILQCKTLPESQIFALFDYNNSIISFGYDDFSQKPF